MAVTIADIQHLRKMSGAGLADCKKALTEAEGDIDKAMELIRQRGQALAAKREDREAAEGCVLAASNGEYAAVVALKCETDFVANNADFVALTQSILDVAMAAKPADLEALKALPMGSSTVQESIVDRSGISGEKMEIGFFEFVSGPATVAYIHPGNKLATVVAFAASAEAQVLRDVAMQVAAMNPVAATREEVSEELVKSEFNVAREKAREEGKPENMLDKIAEGRINKFYKESVLMEQEFVKDPKQTIKSYLAGNTVQSFKRVTLNAE